NSAYETKIKVEIINLKNVLVVEHHLPINWSTEPIYPARKRGWKMILSGQCCLCYRWSYHRGFVLFDVHVLKSLKDWLEGSCQPRELFWLAGREVSCLWGVGRRQCCGNAALTIR
ncbi:hypothetical protein AVEN_157629-1, partial [Araneus ventricosus]